jgi:hypothetical protein
VYTFHAPVGCELIRHYPTTPQLPDKSYKYNDPCDTCGNLVY